jgi:hypothetical protein
MTWKRAENFLDFEAFALDVGKVEDLYIACDAGHCQWGRFANDDDGMFSVMVVGIIYELQ